MNNTRKLLSLFLLVCCLQVYGKTVLRDGESAYGITFKEGALYLEGEKIIEDFQDKYLTAIGITPSPSGSKFLISGEEGIDFALCYYVNGSTKNAQRITVGRYNDFDTLYWSPDEHYVVLYDGYSTAEFIIINTESNLVQYVISESPGSSHFILKYFYDLNSLTWTVDEKGYAFHIGVEVAKINDMEDILEKKKVARRTYRLPLVTGESGEFHQSIEW